MRARNETLTPLNSFESLATHLVVMMVFKLVTLLLSLAGDASLEDENNVVKWTMILAIPMTITYHSYSLVTILLRYPWYQNDHANHPCPARWPLMRKTAMTLMMRRSHLRQVLLRNRMPSLGLFFNLDTIDVSAEKIWKRRFKVSCPRLLPGLSGWTIRWRLLSIA